MTMSTNTPLPPNLAEGLKVLRAKWGWIVALGVVFLIAGFIALGSAVAATASAVMIIGIMMIMGGVAEIVAAFSVKGWGKFAVWMLLGLLSTLERQDAVVVRIEDGRWLWDAG